MVDLFYLIKKNEVNPRYPGNIDQFFSAVSRNQKRAFELIVIMSAASLIELAPMSPN